MRSSSKVVIGSVAVGLLVAMCTVLYGMASKAPAEDPRAEHPKATPPMEKKAAMTQSVCVCPDCEAMALKAGKCGKCGREMVQKHLLCIKDGKAMVCDCAAGCACDPKATKDGKCGCGKEVKMISCKGLYVCPMGCPEISDKAGKCACGMETKKVE